MVNKEMDYSIKQSFFTFEVTRNLLSSLCDLDIDRILTLLGQIKHVIIGSDRKKALLIESNILPWILKTIVDDSMTLEIRRESAFILNSLSKGNVSGLVAIADADGLQVLLKLLNTTDVQLMSTSLRTLRNIFHSKVANADQLYSNIDYIRLLLRASYISLDVRESVVDIFSLTCKTIEHQRLLLSEGIVSLIVPLLYSNKDRVLLPALSCLCVLVLDNSVAAHAFIHSDEDRVLSLSHQCSQLLDRHQSTPVQLAAAKALVYLSRNEAIDPKDRFICNKVLPTIIRCIRDECTSLDVRVDAIETLAYATEVDACLQKLAADNNQCLRELLLFVPGPLVVGPVGINRLEPAALTAIASLTMNEEEVRRRIRADNLFLFASIERAKLKSGQDQLHHLLAVGRLLHALSRSVEQLRTTFHERPIWTLLLEMANSPNDELVAISSAALSNLCLDFSPCKRDIVDAGLVDVLSSLARRESASLRLNGVWGLMNLAYRAEEDLKMRIVRSLQPDHYLRLLTEASTDSSVVLRTLGLIRNVLSQCNETKVHTCKHIDDAMLLHGTSIIQAVVYVLEENYCCDAKEMALCILSNIAAGGTSKDFLVSNEDILRKITNYMLAANSSLQLAATFCIFNLAHKNDVGFEERQSILRRFGVHKLLYQVQNTNDVELHQRAQIAANQF